jgi:cell division protein FtsL
MAGKKNSVEAGGEVASLLKQIAELTKERDDLRWQVCELSSNGSIDDATREMQDRGWA